MEDNKIRDKKYEDIDLSNAMVDWQKKKFANIGIQKRPGSPDASKAVKLIMKYSGGLIKNERQASGVLICIIMLIIIILFSLLFNNNKKTVIEAPPGKNIIYPIDEPPRLQ